MSFRRSVRLPRGKRHRNNTTYKAEAIGLKKNIITVMATQHLHHTNCSVEGRPGRTIVL